VVTADIQNLKRVIGGLSIVAIGLSAFWLARAAIITANPETEWVTPLPVLGSGPVIMGESPRIDANLDIFNRGAEPVAPTPVTIGEGAPETTLDLTLKGLRAGPQDSAFIQTPDRKTGNFYIGDTIIDGVTLEAVNPDFVVIERAGSLERLTIDRDTTLTPAPTLTSTLVRTAQQRRPNPSSKQQLVAGDLIRNVSFDRAMEGGELKGYSISSSNNAGAAQLSAFGFEDGDVVRSINGTNLTRDNTDLLSVLRQFDRRNTAIFLVQRGEDVLTIKVGG